MIAEDGATATFDINGRSFTSVGNTTLGGLGTNATPQIIDGAGTGLITLGGAIIYDSTNDPLGGLISANIALGGALRTFTVNDSVSAATDLTISGGITETGNFSLNLAGNGTGVISGPVMLATTGTSSDVNVNTTGTWIIENAVSFGDDFNANDGTVIVQGAGQIAAATGDDLLLGNDNDSLPAIVELNVANAFVGDDVEVRSGSLLKIGADGALTEGTDAANNPDGMNDLNVGTGGLATPGGSTVDLQGFDISVDNFVLGGRLNSVLPDLIQGNIVDSSVGRTGVITTTANNTLRLGEVSAGLAGTGLLLKEWQGDVTLSGNNTRTGRTEIRGGNLILDFSTATVDTETRLSATDELRMGRNNWDDAPSRLTVNGHVTLDITQTVSNTQFTSGAATIDVNSAGGVMNLNMGAITQNDGATFNLELPVNGLVTTSDADGFIGGWAVVEGSRFANVAGGAIGALTSTVANDLATWLPGADIINDAAFAGSIDCGISINSLAFDAAATSAVPVTGLLDIASGGILVSPNVGANASTISGGSVTTSGGAFYIHQHNTAGLLEISAALTGNATLSKSGDGELLLSGTRNDLGTVYVQEGTLRVTGGDAIDDNSRVRVMGGANTVFEITAGQSETVGIIDGGVGGQGTVLINAGSTLTTNYTSSDTFGGSFAGSGVLVKEGGGNLNANGVSSFTGDVVVNEGLFQLSNIGRMVDAASFTINKGGNLLIDNNGGTRTGDRIGNSTPITLNSADGTFSGGTQPRGLAIRTDQNAATNEDIGVLNIASGASYAALEANNNGTSTESQIIADNFIRTAGATFNVRGRDLASPNNVRTTQLRISNATNQTAFINGMIGGGTGEGTVTRSIVPWAIGETISGANIANTNMGNSFLSYISGRGFSALDLATDYSTFIGAGGATDNVRESLTLDLAGLTSQTVNSLVIHNDNTAASTLNVTGAGAGNTLTNTSGGFLFTVNTGAAASSAHSTVLGGFEDGIATGGSEYVFHVVNPSAAADTATLTANVSSPLISNADIVKSGRGTLVFSAANTAGGGANRTVINEGAIELER